MTIQTFAEEHIAPVAETLQQADSFPSDIWEQMGVSGILGLGCPRHYGGSGFNYEELSLSGLDLTRYGGCLGIGLSWMIHQIISKFLISGFAPIDIKDRWLPDMAAGIKTGSMAVSEPKTGPHPKYLKTEINFSDDNTVNVTGEKTYLTNGPIADFFVIIGKSGQAGTRNLFSACLIPKGNEDLTVLPPLPVPFLKPAPHGGVKLNNCRVSATDSLIGPHDDVYDPIVMGFRTVENSLMMGIVAGALARQVDCLTLYFSEEGRDLPPECMKWLCDLIIISDTARILSQQVAKCLDTDPSARYITTCHAMFKRLSAEFQSVFSGFVDHPSISLPSDITGLYEDLKATKHLGKQSDISAIKKLTGALIKNPTLFTEI